MYARWAFSDINNDEKLTEADRKQLKEFYLQNMVAPKARKALERHLAEEEARKERMQRRHTPGPPHPDRH